MVKGLILCIVICWIEACSPGRAGRKAGYPDCSSNDIEIMDTCLIGKPLRYALDKMKIDSSAFRVIDEPPGFFNGIEITKPDSLKMRIHTEGLLLIDTMNGIIPYPVMKSILDDRVVTEISWLKPFKKKNGHVGKGVLYWAYELRR